MIPDADDVSIATVLHILRALESKLGGDIAALGSQVNGMESKFSNMESKLGGDIAALGSQVSGLQTQVSNVEGRLTRTASKIDGVERRLMQIESDFVGVQASIGDLRDQMSQQGQRLAAIETFPLPPIQQPPRQWATETHSVSMPRRVRVGYSG